MDKETFLTYEPKAAKLFINSRKMGRLSSAYLLYGQRNAPLKETALFLAKSLGCENELLACDNCDACRRFNLGVHPDFVLIDGENETIKKENIQNLEQKFSLSALEQNHRLCYVIHRIDNITEKAANTILKFLEEPKEGQIAILTTYNLDRVLATIRSRTISVRIDPIDPEGLCEELSQMTFSYPEQEGKKKKKEDSRLSCGECYFLSRFFSSKEEVEQAILSNDNFREGYFAAETFLNAFAISKDEASFAILKQAGMKKGAACYNWMYLMIHEIFTAALTQDNDENNPFHDIISLLKKEKEKIQQADEVVKEALAFRQVNYNPILMAARLAMVLEGE